MGLFLYVPRRSADVKLARYLVAKNLSTIKKDSATKRTRTILEDLAKIQEAFFLCSIGTVTYKPGKLKGTTHVEKVIMW